MAVGLALAIAILATGCGRPPGEAPGSEASSSAAPTPAAKAATLRVWLPCGLAEWQGKFDGLIGGTAGGPKLEYEIVNAWELAERLKAAKVKPDLVIMPGDRELAPLEAAGLLDGQPVAWARNQIAVLTPKSNPARIRAFADVARAGKVLVAPETASQGYYARQALQKAGLMAKLGSRLTSPKTPADVYKLLAAGEAPVGLSFAGCAVPMPDTEACCDVAENPKPTGGEATVAPAVTGGRAPEPPKSTKVMVLGSIPADYGPAFPAMVAVAAGAAHAGDAHAAIERLLSDAAQDEVSRFMPAPARSPAAAAGRVELRMYCGAGIRPAVEPVAKLFEQRHPNTRLTVSYAGSGCLLAQVIFSQRGDLYMPGETFYLDQAQQRGLLAGRQHVAYFEPVIVVAKGNPKGVRSVEGLLRPDVRVAMGEPEACAAGMETQKIMERAGLWDALQKRPVRRALNVPELAYWTSIGSVDAAVVWRVQAVQFARYCDAITIPPKAYDPVDISVGLLKFSKHADLAREFMKLLSSPEGQAAFGKAGCLLKPHPS
jgi:molybdate transport system substrate-binding protein